MKSKRLQRHKRMLKIYSTPLKISLESAIITHTL